MTLGLGQVEKVTDASLGPFLPYSTLRREILRDKEKEEASYFQEKKALGISTLIQHVSGWYPRKKCALGCPNRLRDFSMPLTSLSLCSLMSKLNGCAWQTLRFPS